MSEEKARADKAIKTAIPFFRIFWDWLMSPERVAVRQARRARRRARRAAKK